MSWIQLIGIVQAMFIGCFFLRNSKELLFSLEMVTLRSGSDREWLLGVVWGFSISNFNLGCWLFIM